MRRASVVLAMVALCGTPVLAVQEAAPAAPAPAAELLPLKPWAHTWACNEVDIDDSGKEVKATSEWKIKAQVKGFWLGGSYSQKVGKEEIFYAEAAFGW